MSSADIVQSAPETMWTVETTPAQSRQVSGRRRLHTAKSKLV
jgi:hypothetical protein